VAVGVNRLKGVSVGKGVEVGRGVLVAVGSWVGPGVHVAGSTLKGVGVMVGISSFAGSVGGGKGLKAEAGLMKIIKNPRPTQMVINKISTVRIFQTRADMLREGWV
jgi:hypothetical protein